VTQKRWLLLAKGLLTLLLCGWLAGRLDTSRLLRLIEQLDPMPFMLALVMLPANIGFQYRKWALLVRSQLPQAASKRILTSLLAGFTLGTFTPGRLGEHARCAWFGQARTELAALSLVDKFSSASVTSLAGVAGLLLLPRWDLSIFGQAAPLVLWAVGLYACAVLLWVLLGLALLVAPARVTGMLKVLPVIARHERFQRIHAAMVLIERPRRIKLLVAAMAFYITFILQFCLLANALGFSHPLLPAAAAGTMFLKSLFPVTLGDLGVRELFAANLFAVIGAGPELAVSAALLLFVINLVLPTLPGAWLLLTDSGKGAS
jgi:hypothetical protein